MASDERMELTLKDMPDYSFYDHYHKRVPALVLSGLSSTDTMKKTHELMRQQDLKGSPKFKLER